MSKLKTFARLIKEDRASISVALFSNLATMGLLNWMPDRVYLKLKYRVMMRQKLDLKHPKTFNEKIQWLKLYDRKDAYTMMVDKYRVREYIAKRLGEEYLIPLLGVWERPEDIDFDSLPEQFVLKCNHDSGSVTICKDRKTFNQETAIAKLRKGLKTNMYWHAREWPYKNVKPCIIAEQYMEDKQTAELRDYKFFCFDGVVKALFIATERQKEGEEVKFDFFDAEFNYLPMKQGHPNAAVRPEKPKLFEEMKILAEKLSKGIPHVRVDFYEVNEKIYFGELTFSHFSGMVPFDPPEWDERLGELIKIR